ncbi:hypothetical protein [Lacticaseibacillus kribbianus]|uniref:hypothetical protein n=1 Tax=Lacticaseibacillus kribbianus TaxID=2926292 RepID=UPI001CD34068|nr:hypothetical protein [Lacticaseibacillus kribbianus]
MTQAEQQLQRVRRQDPSAENIAAYATCHRLRKMLNQNQYREMNRVLLTAIESHPEFVAYDKLGLFFQSYGHTGGDTILNSAQVEDIARTRLRQYVAQGRDSLMWLDDRQSALSYVYDTLFGVTTHVYKWAVVEGHIQYYSKLNYGTPFTWIFLCYAVLALVVSFTYDRRNETERLMRITPRADQQMQLVRAGVTLLAIAGTLIGALLVAVLVNGALPNHSAGGPWFYPTIRLNGASIIYTPLWLALSRQIGILMLWALVLSGLVFVVTRFVANPTLVLLISALPLYAGPTHLLELLPLSSQALLPSYYLNPPAMLLHIYQYAGTNLGHAGILFVGWALGAWLIGAIVQRIGYRRLGPWLN